MRLTKKTDRRGDRNLGRVRVYEDQYQRPDGDRRDAVGDGAELLERS